MGEVNEVQGTIRLPGNLFDKFQDQSVIDTREGTLIWKAEDVSGHTNPTVPRRIEGIC